MNWSRSDDGKPQTWLIVYRCLNMACHIVKVSFVCGIELGLERMNCPGCGKDMEMQKKEVLNAAYDIPRSDLENTGKG